MITTFFTKKETTPTSSTKRTREEGETPTSATSEGKGNEGAVAESNHPLKKSATTTTATGAAESVADEAIEGAAVAEAPVAPPRAPESDLILVNLLNNMEPSWRSVLQAEQRKPYFKKLAMFVQQQYTQNSPPVYPPMHQVFSVFELCPLDKIKVVVVGQDPYHQPKQAHGLAFSVQKNVAIPASLRNMFTELKNDPATRIREPKHGNLESWCSQGVFMLNAVLTVTQNTPNSHQKQGWEEFTDAVIQHINKHRSNVVYLLWGKPAQAKCAIVNKKNNCIITTSHPSPLGAYQTATPFMESRCFSRCNEYLIAHQQTPIDWNVL